MLGRGHFVSIPLFIPALGAGLSLAVSYHPMPRCGCSSQKVTVSEVVVCWLMVLLVPTTVMV